jgi:murein L,D-transpeptidase YcbB/YkuD
MHREIVTLRSPRPAGRSRSAGNAVLALAAGTAFFLSAPLGAQGVAAGATAVVAATLSDDQDDRAPSWFDGGNAEAAYGLIDLLATSEIDGVSSKQFNVRALQRSVRRALQDPGQVASANRQINAALVRYVAAMRAVAPSAEWTIVDKAALQPAPSAKAILRQAAAAGSMSRFVETMPWMHETYAGLRRALVDAERRRDPVAAAKLRLNLDRVRLLPGSSQQRYILVNAAAQRLYLYEDGKVVDWMRVVVGKATQPTPMMAALIRYTAVNPYWNLPADLVAERIAPNVVKSGLRYLKDKGYVVLSDWSEGAKRVDPATIDWKAVLDGRTEIRMRQNPGPANAMGQMKFMFPNKAGVYLHDTPQKELLDEPARLLSAGCVRLEDAPRVARWLYGRPLRVTAGMKPEQHVDLDKPVPVYLAYLTAVPSGGQAVFYDDIYGRDQKKLAALKVASR